MATDLPRRHYASSFSLEDQPTTPTLVPAPKPAPDPKPLSATEASRPAPRAARPVRARATTPSGRPLPRAASAATAAMLAEMERRPEPEYVHPDDRLDATQRDQLERIQGYGDALRPEVASQAENVVRKNLTTVVLPLTSKERQILKLLDIPVA